MEDKEKSEGLKNFKAKDIKTYCSTEFLLDNKKQYRSVFDKNELSYVYCELSFYNKAFDEENWDANIILNCYEKMIDGVRLICTLKLSKKISRYESLIIIREGWGNKKEGSFWKPGTYYWEAYINDEFVGNKFFYIEDSGIKKFLPGNYLKIKSAKFFEGHYEDLDKVTNTSLITFSAEHTRYIFLELTFENQLLKVLWNCEIFVRYFNEAGEQKSIAAKLRPIKKSEKEFKMIFGFGSNTKGTWLVGKYRMEIVFMSKLIAVIPFNVDNDFIEGTPSIIIPYSDQNSIIKLNDEDDLSFEECLDELNRMIGLKEIKQKVNDHAQYLQFLKLRSENGFKEEKPSSLYLVFTGNPGTGKTTVAKMLGKLYKKMGMLSKGQVLEVDRADLVGEYIGQTAPKVKEVIEKARGGILFIDEAYSLARSLDDNKDFGKEVIEILVKEMSSGKGDLAVIVAGYPKEMKTFIDSNPGLKSRFKYFFEFNDYLPQELIQIAEYACLEKELVLNEPARKKLEEIIIEQYRNRNQSFGNARFVYDLLEKAKINLGLRIMKDNKQKKNRQELMTIIEQDFDNINLENKRELPSIPIDYDLLDKTMKELDNLLGMEKVKNQIRETVELVKYFKETGKNVLSSFYLHTVFVGNPGTGKTTVARILAKIYKALGILERGHIVETDRQGLVAGFVGQTAIKTGERINEAIGGVLFIDEAYALSNFNGLQGDYGNEAIQTLLKKMEDERGKFYVFAAGYPENMDNFLKANPGLSSRFDKILRFDDYSPEELFDIAQKMLKDEGYVLHQKAFKSLKAQCEELYLKRDKYFGNARTIRKMVTEICKNQNLRVGLLALEKRTSKVIQTILVEDLPDKGLDSEGQLYRRKGIGF